MAKQHVSRVQNDFIEQQSQGEMLNSVGSGNASNSGASNGSSNSSMGGTSIGNVPQMKNKKK
jgi:hypothetical protein